ncbi:GntR family transcriptional regulator [Chelativorans intermedius]|uniref:GntR family transcriptional regulator n=1 Tax=Chelativorans intermedius TaxID=515947 RepID=A0ABV6D4G2_9HYPH|nr:GntR family transcriptional regulator [Chelativorans intermedius]MCT8997611.1 GntR family transcriptional regulator [Chelativorans intermedius]
MNAGKAMRPSAAYRSLKTRLMAGEFRAGEKLRPDMLKDAYGISASAMREVFLRLAHESLLVQEEQRGFRVPAASRRRLAELMNLRILLECEGVRQAIREGDLEWEARLAAAHHKLVHIERKMRSAPDIAPFVPLWTRIDWEFHDTLLSACPSEVLRATHRNIYEQFRQQVVAGLEHAGFREETIPEHAAILKAAIERDVPACQAAIHAHLQVSRDEAGERLKSA